MNAYARKEIRKLESMIRGAQSEIAWCDGEPQDDPEVIAYRAQLEQRIKDAQNKIAQYQSPEYARQIAADNDDMMALAW